MINEWSETVNWGAWEAIGTCAAAVVALGLAFGSWRRAAKEERQRHEASLRALVAIMASIENACEYALERLEAGADVPMIAKTFFRTSVLQTSIKALEQFDLTRFRDPANINWIILVQSQAAGMLSVAQDVSAREREPDGFKGNVEHTQKVVSEAKARFEQSIGSRG